MEILDRLSRPECYLHCTPNKEVLLEGREEESAFCLKGMSGSEICIFSTGLTSSNFSDELYADASDP
jgi:hypothetical protein